MDRPFARTVIAVKNIYYLLLYAWDSFDEGRMATIDAAPETDLLNLLTNVLTRGIDQLYRSGLDRGYLLVNQEIAGIRGKVDLAASIKANLLGRARTACEFDELSYDVPHNQVLKATLRRLLRCESLEPEVYERTRRTYLRLPQMTDVHVSERIFRRVQLHRNIRMYRFLVDVCQLLYEQLIPDEATGTFTFRNFSRDEVRMRRLFERFIFSFYRYEQDRFKVRRSRFPWAGATTETPEILPQMNTDVTLLSPTHSIIIDCKYSPNVLQQSPYGTATLNSGHLYQLFAYLKNLPRSEETKLDGLIIYPLGEHVVDSTVQLPGHNVRVYTINLKQHWTLIRRDLLALVLDTSRPNRR